MTARDTYNSSVKAAEVQSALTCFTGQNSSTAPAYFNNTQQYPSIATLTAWYSAGAITYSQFIYYCQQTKMFAQTQIRAAKDTLVGTGDVGPA
jgi:hypothetical protein